MQRSGERFSGLVLRARPGDPMQQVTVAQGTGAPEIQPEQESRAPTTALAAGVRYGQAGRSSQASRILSGPGLCGGSHTRSGPAMEFLAGLAVWAAP